MKIPRKLVLDAQAGFEYAMSIYDSTLNRCNLIHDCGYLEYGSTSSFESVLFADEIIGYIKHMMRPVTINDQTVPLKVMDRVGPGGNFLTEDHTTAHFRQTVFFPRFLDRNNFPTWEGNGSKDLRSALNENAKQIFANHQPEALGAATRSVISRIVAAHKPDV